jgi:hypothetical protein
MKNNFQKIIKKISWLFIFIFVFFLSFIFFSSKINTSIAPYYYGEGAKDLTSLQVSELTKAFQKNTSSFTTTVSPVGEIWYFAYPDSYPPLSSIRDENGFELISDFTMTTGNKIITPSGKIVTYRIYAYNNVTTLSAYKVTYIE